MVPGGAPSFSIGHSQQASHSIHSRLPFFPFRVFVLSSPLRSQRAKQATTGHDPVASFWVLEDARSPPPSSSSSSSSSSSLAFACKLEDQSSREPTSLLLLSTLLEEQR
ncbi:hypothetical protein BT93_H1972 [Corymbia citriodora subsp. variegata]|nr:hypothetical protein BT93_H1972 [Corymbia citriodora subsp. variegata]